MLIQNRLRIVYACKLQETDDTWKEITLHKHQTDCLKAQIKHSSLNDSRQFCGERVGEEGGHVQKSEVVVNPCGWWKANRTAI